MDWLTNALQQTWAQAVEWGISVGTLGVVGWNTFVSSRLGSKRVDKLLDFTTVAHKTFTDVGSAVKVQLETFKNDLVNSVVKPLQSQVSVEQKEKVFWQDMAISALATANVPLSQKQVMYEFAKKQSKVSAEVLAILEQSIQNDILKLQQANQEQDTLKDTLNGV